MPLYSFDAATVNMQLVPEFTTDPRITVGFRRDRSARFPGGRGRQMEALGRGGQDGLGRPNEARTDVGLPPDMDEATPMNTGQPTRAPR